MNWKSIVAGAIGGFIAAAMIDVNAWAKSEGEFDWKLAFKRWVAGATAGVMGGLGSSQIPLSGE